MDFALSPTASRLRDELLAFMDDHVYPSEPIYRDQMEESGDPHHHPAVLEELKAEARRRGLWNLFLPHKTKWTDGLSNLDYAPLAEVMGRSAARFRGVQLLGARHREHGGPRPCSAPTSRRSGGWNRCSKARSAPPSP